MLVDHVVNARVGCMQAGDRSIYVDARGHARSCVFCARDGGSLLERPLADALADVRVGGCGRFETSRLYKEYRVGDPAQGR